MSRTCFFVFDARSTHLLDDLKDRTHSSSRTEVIRKALYLLDLTVQARKSNERLIIQSHDKSEEKEISIN